jgi:RHS repeat-associated protein
VELDPGEGYWIHVSSAANLTVPAPAEQEYHYDSQGRRLGSIVIYDGVNQIAKYDDLGNLLVSYFQGPGIDNPVSMTINGQTYYYHMDALGSVTELTDASNAVAQSYRYDAFGSIIQQTGNVQNPFTYTGREYDPETGLYYYRARYYDAKVGRFLSRDPVFSTNVYTYVKNHPIMRTDPTGMVECSCSPERRLEYLRCVRGVFDQYVKDLNDCQSAWAICSAGCLPKCGWLNPACIAECEIACETIAMGCFLWSWTKCGRALLDCAKTTHCPHEGEKCQMWS